MNVLRYFLVTLCMSQTLFPATFFPVAKPQPERHRLHTVKARGHFCSNVIFLYSKDATDFSEKTHIVFPAYDFFAGEIECPIYRFDFPVGGEAASGIYLEATGWRYLLVDIRTKETKALKRIVVHEGTETTMEYAVGACLIPLQFVNGTYDIYTANGYRLADGYRSYLKSLVSVETWCNELGFCVGEGCGEITTFISKGEKLTVTESNGKVTTEKVALPGKSSVSQPRTPPAPPSVKKQYELAKKGACASPGRRTAVTTLPVLAGPARARGASSPPSFTGRRPLPSAVRIPSFGSESSGSSELRRSPQGSPLLGGSLLKGTSPTTGPTPTTVVRFAPFSPDQN